MFIIAFVIGLIWCGSYLTIPVMANTCTRSAANEAAAEVSGVNVKKTKIIIYVTAAALVSNRRLPARRKSASAVLPLIWGQGLVSRGNAACTIGGVSVNGGIGRISGAVIGVLRI